MEPIQVAWKSVRLSTYETVSLTPDSTGITVTSHITRHPSTSPLDAHHHGESYVDYTIALDHAWVCQSFRILRHDTKTTLEGVKRSYGWTLSLNDQPVAVPQGHVIDLDIRATPMTNTLPIRRTAWVTGQAQDFQMLYVDTDTMTCSVSPQRYTRLSTSDHYETSVFRYEGLERGVDYTLAVNRHGLVMQYGDIWRMNGYKEGEALWGCI